MQDFLAFLRILQIIGGWIWAAVSNFHITSGLILLMDGIIRLTSNVTYTLQVWEYLLLLYLCCWFGIKYYRSANRGLWETVPVIKLDNRNQNNIIIGDTQKLKPERLKK